MRKLILIILLVLFSVKVYAKTDFKPFKAVFLPDTHISFEKTDDWILYKESFVIFQDVMKNMKAEKELDYVVFGGDLTDNDDNMLGDMPLFLDSLENVSFNYFAILGDRDADLKESYSKQDFCAEFRRNGFENPDLTYWSHQQQDNVLFIGLDTSVNNRFEGKIPPEELIWLDNVLKSNPDKFSIIFMHHPAVETTHVDKTLWKKYILENSREFLKVINKYPQVKLVFSAHHHNFAVQNINNKLFVSTPSIVTYPNSYKIIKVYPDRIEVENRDISYKQIIKKSKNTLVKTEYAKQFDAKKPEKVLKYQRGDEYSKNKVYYYSSMVK